MNAFKRLLFELVIHQRQDLVQTYEIFQFYPETKIMKIELKTISYINILKHLQPDEIFFPWHILQIIF